MRTPELFDLHGKKALVTGGGRGIGRHIAIGLAEAGADVCVASRTFANCQATADAIGALGRRGVALEADVSQPEQVRTLAERALEELSGIDILVNNAGMAWAAPILEYPLEAWDRVFDLNVRGVFFLSQHVARHMATASGGSIIHVSSISAWRSAPDEEEPVIAYGASKGALLSLTRDMAVKLAPDHIRVNCIAPGAFLTDMMNHVRSDAQALERFEARIPQRRSGREDDMKGAAVFLASDASAYVTGHTLVVDGGWSCV